MISRNVTLTINDANVSLDKKVLVCKGDKGIVLNINLKTNVYKIGEEIVKARALIKDPSGDVKATNVSEIVGNIFALNLDDVWVDGAGEAGKYTVQIQLYGAEPANNGLTLQSFQIEVVEPIADIPLA